MREVLMEQFQSGELTLAELRTEVENLREAHIESLEALLDARQFEIVRIHTALVVRVGMRGHHGRHGGPEGQGPR